MDLWNCKGRFVYDSIYGDILDVSFLVWIWGPWQSPFLVKHCPGIERPKLSPDDEGRSCQETSHFIVFHLNNGPLWWRFKFTYWHWMLWGFFCNFAQGLPWLGPRSLWQLTNLVCDLISADCEHTQGQSDILSILCSLRMPRGQWCFVDNQLPQALCEWLRMGKTVSKQHLVLTEHFLCIGHFSSIISFNPLREMVLSPSLVRKFRQREVT